MKRGLVIYACAAVTLIAIVGAGLALLAFAPSPASPRRAPLTLSVARAPMAAPFVMFRTLSPRHALRADCDGIAVRAVRSPPDAAVLRAGPVLRRDGSLPGRRNGRQGRSSGAVSLRHHLRARHETRAQRHSDSRPRVAGRPARRGDDLRRGGIAGGRAAGERVDADRRGLRPGARRPPQLQRQQYRGPADRRARRYLQRRVRRRRSILRHAVHARPTGIS